MRLFANMFDAWFKPKFLSKCKSNIDATLTRIDMIKRRRKAMEKYLRSDVGELIKAGLASNAYERVDRLYLDQNRTLCYDFVEQFCTLILNHLLAINNQSECPDECKEAVSSLIYAAARFADLPELRVLRTLFSERYGDSLESFANKEFINLLKPDRPTKDMKIQLMREIAFEHGVEWDPESLDKPLPKPPSEHELSQTGNGDQDNDSRITNHENGWMIKFLETRNKDNNDREKDDSNDEVEKQTENLRRRILDYWSRTTNLLWTSRETTTSSDENSSSSSSDDSTKSRPFFPFRLMPPPYVKNNLNKNGKTPDSSSNISKNNKRRYSNKENQDISNYEEPTISCVRNKRRRKGGAKSHSTECLPNQEAPKGHLRTGSYHPDLSVDPPTGHVHPRLPDYDDIIARFAALRAKS